MPTKAPTSNNGTEYIYMYIGSETANPRRALNIEQAWDVKDQHRHVPFLRTGVEGRKGCPVQ